MPKKMSEEKLRRLLKRIETGKWRRGVTAMAPDGRLFFLTESQARRTAFVDKYGAYAKFLAMAKRKQRGKRVRAAEQPDVKCPIYKRWLDENDPSTPKWREVSLMWGGRC